MKFIFFIFFISYLFPQLPYCPNQIGDRSIYEIGDTLSVDDQNMLFPVCNGAGDYSIGDSFSFSDLNGDLNGGEYKITLISMNATW
tara:strand:+ start:128 stop:385 length:258 start_codon:yes stop_codon:yes gene_type:complete